MPFLIRVWLRAGLSRWLLPLALGWVIAIVLTDRSWSLEWGFGMRRVLTTTGQVTPILAGVVAFDMSRQWAQFLSAMPKTNLRWRRATAAVAMAPLLMVLVAYGVAFAVAAAMLARNQAFGSPDLWFVGELVAVLSAATATGAAMGMRVGTPLAAPAAACLVLVAQMWGTAYGLDTAYNAMGAVNSTLGLERNPSAAALSIMLNMLIAAVAALVAVRPQSLTGSYRLAIGVAVAALVLVGGVSRSGFADRPEYRVQGPSTCLRSSVEICGPGSATAYLRELGQGIDRAMAQLADSGLDFPSRYDLFIPGTYPATDSAIASIELPPYAYLRADPASTMAHILASPRVCPEMVTGGPGLGKLLDAQATVETWLKTALASSPPVGPAPKQVVDAYRRTLDCQG